MVREQGDQTMTIPSQNPSQQEQEKWLTEHGFFVGERNPRANTDIPGRFMVIDNATLEQINSTSYSFPDASHLNGGYCAVDDDLAEIVWEAYVFHCDA